MIERKEERSIVTFALFAYNQERFIKDAIEAALAQDYSPLEIIFSDDCSTDNTFEIMNKFAEKYSGPHVIKLNKNTRNLGIADHINVVMKMVTTDFVVVAAGDDVSEQNRTSEMVKVWLSSKGGILSVHSSSTEIDENGVLTGNLRKGCEDIVLNDINTHVAYNYGVLGATHAWDMRLIRQFPPILSCVINEDVILPARASLLGGRVEYIDKPLVKYRVGVGVTHEVFRCRAARKYDLSLPLLKRPYYSFLQKFHDYKFVHLLQGRRERLARARAAALYPIWLRRGCVSRLRVAYFCRRCNASFLFWELIKYAFPSLVALKQRLQFDYLPKLKGLSC